MKKIISILSFMALVFSACTKDIIPVVNTEDEVAAASGSNKFIISVADRAGSAETKASKSSWTKGDKIRVYFKDGEDASYMISEENSLSLTYDGYDWLISHNPEQNLTSGDFLAFYFENEKNLTQTMDVNSYGRIMVDSGEILSQDWAIGSDGNWAPAGESYKLEDGAIKLDLNLKRHPEMFKIVVPGYYSWEEREWEMYIASNSYGSSLQMMSPYTQSLDYITVNRSFFTDDLIVRINSSRTYVPGYRDEDDNLVFYMIPKKTVKDDMDSYTIYLYDKNEDHTSGLKYVIDRGANGDGTFQKTFKPNMCVELPNLWDWEYADTEYISYIYYETTDGKILEPTRIQATDYNYNEYDKYENTYEYDETYRKAVGKIKFNTKLTVIDLSYEADPETGSTLSYFRGPGWTATLESAANMFANCNNLEMADLTFLDLSYTQSTERMFYNCKSLKTVNSFSIPQANIRSMKEMFYGCESLTYIPFFRGKSEIYVVDYTSMFEGCKSLVTLDLSSLNANYVSKTANMFKGCSALKTLNVSNMETAFVYDMSHMFDSCSSLTSLDLSSFTINGAHSGMFRNTSSLKSITVSEKASGASANEDAFTGIAENGTLYYPASADMSAWLSDTALGKYGWTGSEL